MNEVEKIPKNTKPDFNREFNHQQIVDYLTKKLSDCNGNKKLSSNQALLKKIPSFNNFSPHMMIDGNRANERLIDKMKQKIENNEPWFSLEFFPPRTKPG